jgi:hypothetical protein
MSTTWSIMSCHECHLDAGPFAPEEAAVHAATHDRLHHRGARTAAAVTPAALPTEATAAA